MIGRPRPDPQGVPKGYATSKIPSGTIAVSWPVSHRTNRTATAHAPRSHGTAASSAPAANATNPCERYRSPTGVRNRDFNRCVSSSVATLSAFGPEAAKTSPGPSPFWGRGWG